MILEEIEEKFLNSGNLSAEEISWLISELKRGQFEKLYTEKGVAIFREE